MSRIDSRFKTILASILIACIVLNLFPLTLLALDEPYYSVSDEYDFSVTRVISSRWEKHANIDFIITNNGDTTINNWYITTDLPYEVENIWNASVAEASDSYVTISSVPYDQPIEPGCSVTFGITGYSEDESLFDIESSFYLLNIEDVVIPVEKYQATTNVYSTTETGCSGAIAITNISSELLTIENIVLNSTNGLTIYGNAAIEDDTTLVVDASSRNIYPGASIYINFEGTSEIPEVAELRYTGLAFTLTEDEDNDGILDIDEFLYPEEDPEVTPIPTIAPTNTPEVEPTETPTVTPEEEPTPTPEEVTPTPTIDPFEALSDVDMDGLFLDEEYSYGTDPNNYDTDSDGISDGDEVNMNYSPLNQDSNLDGVLDSNEDFDGDGIINIVEASSGTCLYAPDSDFDGLNDYDEIYVYGSDPRNKDTDGDGIHDGDELTLGHNPTLLDSDGDGILDNEEKFLQDFALELINESLPAVSSVNVSIELANLADRVVEIRDIYNIDVYSSEIESLVGSPVDITCEEAFTEAIITFTYVPELLDCSPEDLGILWYDEESGFYEVQDSVLDTTNNAISTTVNHFSKYMVINKTSWSDRWDYILNGYSYDVMPEEEEFEGIDYSIHIQVGPTVSGAQRQQMYDAFLELTTIMGPNDTLTVGIMSERGCFWSHVGLNIETATALMEEYVFPSEESSNYINLMDHHNYHSVRTTFPSVMTGFGSFTGDNREHINILMLDPDILYRNSEPGYELQAIPRAYGNDTNQSLYFVVPNEASANNKYLLTAVPYSNGGILQVSDNIADDFLELRNLNREVDEDEDGLYDIHEERGMVLTNGQIIYTDANSNDTDGDGYEDNEELELVVIRRTWDYSLSTNPSLLTYVNGNTVTSHPFITNRTRNTGCWRIYRAISDPTVADSDMDGFADYEDARPHDVNEKIIYLFNLEELEETTIRADYYASLYEEEGYTVIRGELNSTESFENCWEAIGLYCSLEDEFIVDSSEDISYDGNTYGDKYYYDAEHVVIVSHGRENLVRLDPNDDIGTDYLVTSQTQNSRLDLLYIDQLPNRRIGSLNLYTCLNGKTRDDEGDSITNDFLLYHSNIQQVVAADGVISGETASEPYYFMSYLNDDHYHCVSELEFRMYFSWYALDEDYWVRRIGLGEVNSPDCSGFRCFTRDGGSYDIFEDDVIYGDIYYYVEENGTVHAIFVSDSGNPNSFSSRHEYILDS